MTWPQYQDFLSVKDNPVLPFASGKFTFHISKKNNLTLMSSNHHNKYVLKNHYVQTLILFTSILPNAIKSLFQKNFLLQIFITFMTHISICSSISVNFMCLNLLYSIHDDTLSVFPDILWNSFIKNCKNKCLEKKK